MCWDEGTSAEKFQGREREVREIEKAHRSTNLPTQTENLFIAYNFF